MSGWQVDFGRAGDGDAVARLLREVPPEPLRDLTIWSSSRFPQYFEDMLERRNEPAMPRFFVLRSGCRVGGAFSLRPLDGEIVLDNLCVEPALRAQYWGIRLMLEGIQAILAEAPSETIVSDVFAGRAALEKFHRSIGGVDQPARGWWILPSPAPSCPKANGQIRGFEEAERQHRRWGFSMFSVCTRSAEYSVGRLPGPYFRLTDPKAAHDAELLETLAAVDSRRELFLIGPVECPDAGWKHVARLNRFRARRQILIPALQQYFASNESSQ